MYKLLIVDDEVEVRNGYAHFYPWETVGFIVCGTAANGVEALNFIARHEVDVILCDIAMPVMDGISLAQKVSEIYPHILLIMLTAYSEMEQMRKLMKCHIFSYVLKHEKNEVLLTVMRECKEALDLNKERREDTIITKIKNYVRENLGTASLSGAADLVGLSESYVSRIFKEENQQNFYAFVLECRIARAKQLLAETNQKVYTIADQMGYTDAKNFNRIFKKIVGISPKEYQLRCKNAEKGKQEL